MFVLAYDSISCYLTDKMQAVLMIFVLDTAIGFGVWLPFTFGKSTALLLVRDTDIHS